MGKLFLLFLSISLGPLQVFAMEEDVQDMSFEDLRYKNQLRSQIPWKEINPSRWLDLGTWIEEREKEIVEPYWEVLRRDLAYKEVVGKFLGCVGDCRVYRGLGFHQARYQSRLRERDELETGKDSYAWIYFMDGSLLRVSPETSVSFKEINIGSKKILLSFRVNHGHIHYRPYHMSTHLETDKVETDVLFTPLKMYEANVSMRDKELVNEDPWQWLNQESVTLRQIKRYNALLEENKNIKQKETTLFLNFPQATFVGSAMALDLFVTLVDSSYIKLRSLKDSYSIPLNAGDNQLLLRGYKLNTERILQVDKWYEVDGSGRKVTKHDERLKTLGLGELLTKRIPTILIAQQVWFQKFSEGIQNKLWGSYKLAKDAGYRLWNDQNEKSEFSKRISFLKRFTRRLETTLLLSYRELGQRLKRDKTEATWIKYRDFHSDYYSLAFKKYLDQLGAKRSDPLEVDLSLSPVKQKLFILEKVQAK